MNVAIIGAGIGGLTIAISLQQQGIGMQLYESAAEIKPVGAGIMLANNAMQVFRSLGIHEKIAAAGNKVTPMKITDAKLKPLSVVDLSTFEQKSGVSNIAIHRGDLQKILAGEVGLQNIHLSQRLAKVEQDKNYKLVFEDGTFADCEYLIGADGLRSVVRDQLFEKSTLRNAQQISWRGVCEMELPKKYNHELNEAWGRGKRMGFVQIGAGKIYRYVTAKMKYANVENDQLSGLCREFHPDMTRLISVTPKEQIIRTDISDLKPIPAWHKGNACLIGDAAHATTPSLGQGACQAIEDANVLGRFFGQGLTAAECFAAYEGRRRKKALDIVRTSWVMGKVAHVENPIAIAVRNMAMKYQPKFISRQQMEKIFIPD